MKKILSIIAILCLILGLAAGCSGQKSPNASGGASESVRQIGSAASVDVDLTAFEGTMLTGELKSLFTNYRDNLGKTVRIRGTYSSAYDENTKKTYHNVITGQDPTGCCPYGMEFVWSGTDYPKENAPIEVTGVFESYMEDGKPWCRLKVK